MAVSAEWVSRFVSGILSSRLISYVREYRVDFTPVVADAASGGNVASAAAASGVCIRQGSKCHVTMRLIDINTTGLTGGNPLHIRGFPFAAKRDTRGHASPNGITYSSYVVSSIGGGTSSINLAEHTSGGNAAFITVSDLTSGSADILLTIEFEVQ